MKLFLGFCQYYSGILKTNPFALNQLFLYVPTEYFKERSIKGRNITYLTPFRFSVVCGRLIIFFSNITLQYFIYANIRVVCLIECRNDGGDARLERFHRFNRFIIRPEKEEKMSAKIIIRHVITYSHR